MIANYSTPLVTTGFRKKGNKEGHTWLISGVKGIFSKYTKNGILLLKASDVENVYYWCNWGWSGSSDGWYRYTNVELPIPSPDGDPNPFLAENRQFFIYHPNRVPAGL